MERFIPTDRVRKEEVLLSEKNIPHDGQCTYNVRMRRVRKTFLPWKSNKYYVL